MGWDIDRFPEGEVNLELICCICTCILEDPVESPCRHVFCSQCIKTWLSNHKSCPHCRAPVHKRDLKSVIPLLKNIISRQKIYCDNKERGCNDIVTLENLQGHIASCAYGMVACSYEGCMVRVLRKDHKVHSEMCSKRTVLCEQGCEMFLTLGEKDTHNCISALRTHFQDVTNEILGRISKLEELVNDLVSKNMNDKSSGNRHVQRGGGRSTFRRGPGNSNEENDTFDCLSYNIPSPRSNSSEPPPYTVLNGGHRDEFEEIHVEDYSNEDNDNDNVVSDFSESPVESEAELNQSEYRSHSRSQSDEHHRHRDRERSQRRRSFSISPDIMMSPTYDITDRRTNTAYTQNRRGRENRYDVRRRRDRSRSPLARTVTEREVLENNDDGDTGTNLHPRSNRNSSRNYALGDDNDPEDEENADNSVVLRIGVSEVVSDSSSSSSSSTDSETD